MHQKRSISSDLPTHRVTGGINFASQGLDLLALELYSDAPVRNNQLRDLNNDPFDCFKNIHDEQPYATFESPNFPVAGPSFVKNSTPWSHHLNKINSGNSHNQQQTNKFSGRMQLPDRLNITFHENCLYNEQENFLISPPEQLLKCVRFQNKNQNPSTIVQHWQSRFSSDGDNFEPRAPNHPMWDTPQDLRTSYFSNLHFSWYKMLCYSFARQMFLYKKCWNNCVWNFCWNLTNECFRQSIKVHSSKWRYIFTIVWHLNMSHCCFQFVAPFIL